MKDNLRWFAVLGGCCFLGALAGRAHGQGFYVDAQAGASLADDVTLKQFILRTPGNRLELDPGAHLSVAGGYNVNDYVGAQLETGVTYNDVKRVSGSGGGNIDATLGHVPMLANLVLRYDKPDVKWVPYAGAGAGGDLSIITLDHVRGPTGAIVDGSGTDVVFAWQAFAGARYKFNDTMSIGAGYKFYSAEGAAWDVEHTRGDIKSGTARIHSFGVDFNMKF